MARRGVAREAIQTTPVLTLSIANLPDDLLKNPVMYSRLDAIWIDHQGLVSFPKPQLIFTCNNAKYVGGDLWLIKQGTWKIASPFFGTVYYDTGVSDDAINAVLITDLDMLITSPSGSFVMSWDVSRNNFKRKSNSNLNILNEAKSLAVFQNRVFAIVGSSLLWSTASFKSDVVDTGKTVEITSNVFVWSRVGENGQEIDTTISNPPPKIYELDPFDFNRGAGFDYYNTAIAYNPKLFVIGDSLYLFGVGGFIVYNFKGSVNLTLSKLEYPQAGLGEILYTDREFVIASTGLFQLKGTRLQKIDFPVAFYTQTVDGAGFGLYAGKRMYFLKPQNKNYSIVFYPEIGIYATYPEAILISRVWGSHTYALIGNGLYRLFATDQFHDFLMEFDILLPQEVLVHEVILKGNFGLATVSVNDKLLQVRQATTDYRRFYSSLPIKAIRPKFSIMVKDAVIRAVEVKHHAGRLV